MRPGARNGCCTAAYGIRLGNHVLACTKWKRNSWTVHTQAHINTVPTHEPCIHTCARTARASDAMQARCWGTLQCTPGLPLASATNAMVGWGEPQVMLIPTDFRHEGASRLGCLALVAQIVAPRARHVTCSPTDSLPPGNGTSHTTAGTPYQHIAPMLTKPNNPRAAPHHEGVRYPGAQPASEESPAVPAAPRSRELLGAQPRDVPSSRPSRDGAWVRADPCTLTGPCLQGTHQAGRQGEGVDWLFARWAPRQPGNRRKPGRRP